MTQAETSLPVPVPEPSIPGNGGYGTITPIRDPDRARELSLRGHAARAARRELAILRSLKGMRKAVAEIDPTSVSWADAWERIVGKQAALAHTGKAGSTQAAVFVGRAGDLLSDEHRADDSPGDIVIRMSAGAVSAIANALGRVRQDKPDPSE